MDIDNASLAMDMLRAASEQNEATHNTPSDNTNLHTLPSPTEFVSQFRIDGQPILPPLMTAEKRQLMRELRHKAAQLEANYSKAHAVKKISNSDESCCGTSNICSWNTKKNNGSHSSIETNDGDMDSTHKIPKLQQTATYIYDNKLKPQELVDRFNSPRHRPQTLEIQSQSSLTTNTIPTICVNPPTPLCNSCDQEEDPDKQPGTPSSERKSRSRELSTHHRKLNSITTRILQFEDPEHSLNKLEAAKMLWQNDTLIPLDKRMLRSCTSPLLNSAQLNMPSLHRSRSFTLDQPSQVLVEHMEREGKKARILPPLETQPRYRSMLSDEVSVCSSAQSLDHLRRDTVESKAKQVQRSVSSSFLETVNSPSATRKCGGNSLSLQNNLEELLQQALQERLYAKAERSQIENKQLEMAKQRMFKDIKSAHRDRFKQLVQYQHEEQRRMQQEFDRQQKFLIEQICLEINASAYTHDTTTGACNQTVVSEYTSTDDLPTPSQSSPTTPVPNSMDSTLQSYAEFDKMFDKEAQKGNASSPRSMILRNRNNNNNTISNSSKMKKPGQRIDLKSPGPRKVAIPVTTAAKSAPAKKAINKTTTVATKSNTRSQNQQKLHQQQPLFAKAQPNGSATRQTLPENDVEKRRHSAATILTAATRGYLVRRLFRTEQVQRIVQTIRDTLIFVLNLHMETYGNSPDQEDQANIRLKARLLQQLCSASRTLHLIFFQTSIKERMEIISRDRKRIKTKLLEMHVKHRH